MSREKETAPGPESPYLKPPQKWADRLRLQSGQEIGVGCYVTDAKLLQRANFRFSYLTIPKGPPQFKLETGIYVVTTIQPDDVIHGRFTDAHLSAIGADITTILDDPHDPTPRTYLPLPNDLKAQLGADKAKDIKVDLGNNVALNLRDETMGGGLLWEVMQLSQAALQDSLRNQLRPRSQGGMPPVNRKN